MARLSDLPKHSVAWFHGSRKVGGRRLQDVRFLSNWRTSHRLSGALLLTTTAGGLLTCGYYTKTAQGWVSTRTLHNDSSKDAANWPSGTPEIGKRRKGGSDYELQFRKDEGKPGQQAPPRQTKMHVDGQEKEAKADSSWQGIAAAIASLPDTVTHLGDTIAGYIVPDWIRILPGFIKKLQNELSIAPGTLADEIWKDANDPETNPEIVWDARVRISGDLCEEEKQFRQKRKVYVRRALAKYLGMDENEIHPDDVPTIAMCGSGGGLRALVAGSSSYLSAQEAGLFDCVTYTAGVSGSCWLQALYYSSLTGQCHQKLISHLKNRLGVHIAYPPPALAMLNSAPTNKYLLSGVVEKYKGVPGAEFGIVDIYGLLLASRLLVPKGELAVNDEDLKISSQRLYVDNGANPLPIYTAVRHEIPPAVSEGDAEAHKHNEAWFQWFEFTPYEMWCEELGAGIPTWAVGREFSEGKCRWRDNGLALPELRLTLLMGIWGSAFCATLSHYYKEIRPVVQGIVGFAGIDQMIADRDHDLVKMHPIDPAVIPNYALGLRGALPHSTPESMFETTNLQLMDAGMSNNLPLYPLLREGRDVDIVIAFDASADVRTDNWLKVAEGYTKQRGIVGWPVGAGWPPANASTEEIAEDLEAAQAHNQDKAIEKLEEAQSTQAEHEKKHPHPKGRPDDLGYCNVWIGTTEERITEEELSSGRKRVEEDWELTRPDAGVAVIYFPFLANPKVKGVDPRTSDFMSTWNFVYSPKNIDKVVDLARANFEEGKEQTKRTVRAVYERKKSRRLAREAEEKERRRRWKIRTNRVGRGLGEADHGDQFS